MTCNNNTVNSDERFINQQEHRKISRLWELAISRINLHKNIDEHDPEDKREVHFDRPNENDICAQELEDNFPSEMIQKTLAKGKSFAKKKSPLQKFDEIVTRELTSRRLSEDGGIPSFESSKNWPSLRFTGSKYSEFGRSKISVENKISRGALLGVEKELKDGDPSDVNNCILMDAIEKLAQAQAFCRFDAAVKAAEEATASVPPEKAEEVAVACAKDYQSEIVDIINEKIPVSEEKKPIEVIGYIGVTKLKENL